jgi:hypothetical protein
VLSLPLHRGICDRCETYPRHSAKAVRFQGREKTYVSMTTMRGFSLSPARNHWYFNTPGSFSRTYSQIFCAISST